MTALPAVVALCALCVLMLPLILQPGLAPGNDTAVHVGNVVESAHLLARDLPPWDWLPDVAGGYGGPNYVFYGHLGFVLPAFLVNLGASPVVALRVAIAFAIAVGAVTSYLWCASAGGRFGGFAGAVLFASGPYFLGLPYVRGSYPEFFAYALYPLVFLLARRWMARGALGDLLGGSLAFAAVVSIHTLSLVLIAPFLIVYSTAVGMRTGSWKSAIPRVLALLGATALISSHFLVGPFLETDKVELSGQFETPELYKTMGVPWYAMFNRDPLEGHIVSYALPGRAHLVACGVALATAIAAASERLRRSLLGHLGLAIAALLLVEESVARVSVDLAPPLKYLQFPWRWLGVFNLFACSALAGVFHHESPVPPKARPLVACALPLLCLWLYAGMIPPQAATRFRTETREGIRRSLTTLDHEDKYMPVGSRGPEALAPDVLLEVDVPGARVEQGSQGLNDHEFTVHLPMAASPRFHQYLFDGWRCEVDGQPVQLEQVGELGICGFTVPEGTHAVRLRFGRTPLRWLGFVTSLSTAALAGLGLLLGPARRVLARCHSRSGAAQRRP